MASMIESEYAAKAVGLHERNVEMSDIMTARGYSWDNVMDVLSRSAYARLASMLAEDDRVDKEQALSLLISATFSELETSTINPDLVDLARHEYDYGSDNTPAEIVEQSFLSD